MNQTPAKRASYDVQSHKNFMPTMDELKDLMSLCRVLADTPFYAKLGAGGVLAIWLTARELNLPPMMCLNGGLYNIEGKVSMSAQLMNMLIINAGHEVEVVYLNNTGCKLKFIRNRKDGTKKVDEFEFNQQNAIDAKYFGVQNPDGTWNPKPKSNWIMYPRAMYFARTLSAGGKMFLPDVLMNIYAMDEVSDVDVEIIDSEQKYVDQLIPLGKASESNQRISEIVGPGVATKPEKIEVSVNQLQEFKKKFKIGEQSNYEIYLSAIADKTKKSLEEMVISACLNEKGFIESFDKWNGKNKIGGENVAINTPEI